MVGIVLSYPEGRPTSAGLNGGPAGRATAQQRRSAPAAGKPRFGLIGAGTFATATLIPGLADAGFELGAVASASGLSAADAKQRFGFATAHGDPEEIIDRDDLDLIAIATPPRLARRACRALAGSRASPSTSRSRSRSTTQGCAR